MPAPTTIIFLGIFFRARAPVEERTFSSSKERNGSGVGSDPVARMKFLEVYSLSSTWMVWGSLKVAVPVMVVILFFLKRALIPRLKPATTSPFRFIIWEKLIVGFASMPWVFPLWIRSAYISVD